MIDAGRALNLGLLNAVFIARHDKAGSGRTRRAIAPGIGGDGRSGPVPEDTTGDGAGTGQFHAASRPRLMQDRNTIRSYRPRRRLTALHS